MNKKYILIFSLIIILIGGGIFYFWSRQRMGGNATISRTYPQISNYTFYSIQDIKQNKFPQGSYNTEGYVVQIYTCPPCSKGAQCEICMRDNIVISENNQPLQAFTLSNKELILFTDDSRQFELGKKYQFSVKILGYKSTQETINDVEIVGYNF